MFLSRSPKRRRSRSNSRTRRSRHRRSRSRSRERRHHSPRSRSQDRREREKERERRQKGLPPLKTETLSSESESICQLPWFFYLIIFFIFFIIHPILDVAFILLFFCLPPCQFAVQLCGLVSWIREHTSRTLPVYWRSLGKLTPSM